MIQFDLDVWLKNPSRRLCTRNGLPARIVCWDRKIGLTASGDFDDFPIVALIDCEDTAGEFVILAHKNGRNNLYTDYDLFFTEDDIIKDKILQEWTLEAIQVASSHPHIPQESRNIYIKYVFPWVRSLFNKLNLRYNKIISNIS